MRCNLRHQREVNLESLLLTIKLWIPCSLTTLRRYFQDSSKAVIVVWTGIRWTMLVIRHTLQGQSGVSIRFLERSMLMSAHAGKMAWMELTAE